MTLFVDEPDRPQHKPCRITTAPRTRQLYWCDLWNEAELPEFHKRRPVLIISSNNRLNGHVTVLPTTTIAQPGNRWAHELSRSLDRRTSWVICDQPISIANSRLVQAERVPTVIPIDEYAVILKIMARRILPREYWPK